MKRLLLLLSLAACGVPELDASEQDFSSAESTLLDFEFDGELTSASQSNLEGKIESQLYYTVGHFNGDRAVARLDHLELTRVRAAAAGGKYRVTYHARLPVSYGRKTDLPTSYELRLPRDVDTAGQEAFATKYGPKCVSADAHEVDADSLWYYYRPNATGCALDAADIVKLTARASLSTKNTSGKYPEYHKVWEDGVLDVVAIFGKYESGATTAADAGIAGYNKFVNRVKSEIASVSTTPAKVGTAPGVGAPDITFTATLATGRRLKVTALLVDNVRTAGATFDARYEALSTTADAIVYSGHAGLGSNVRALARKGRFVAGKYVIVFMNGCDTFAYVDGALAEARARVNPDDPTGSKYMEFITNGMPAFFTNMPGATMALVKGLIKVDAPQTYEKIFASIDKSQVVNVTGEEDNVFVPGYTGTQSGGAAWAGVTERGSVDDNEELQYSTPELAPGRYLVALSGSGDADLYVKTGAQPTRDVYDCRPYTATADETCTVTLTARQKIFVSVFGYGEAPSEFVLAMKPESATAPAWAGIDESVTLAQNVEKRWQTPQLAAGKYVVEITGSGDADLYVKSGTAPTTSSYECRPYTGTSNERCTISLSAATSVHVLVRGYAATSTLRLVARAE